MNSTPSDLTNANNELGGKQSLRGECILVVTLVVQLQNDNEEITVWAHKIIRWNHAVRLVTAHRSSTVQKNIII